MNPLRSFFAGGRFFLFATLLMASLLGGVANADTATVQTVDTGGTADVGQYTSQAIVNGNPAIAYYNVTNGDLKYARNSAADGSGSWTTVTVDTGGPANVGYYNSMAIVNGFPAISYYDVDNKDLKFVRAQNADGNGAWNAPQVIDSIGDVGYDTSLVIVNGFPAISYYDNTTFDLKFVRALNIDGGGAWNAPQTIDSTGITGFYTSMAIVNGFPAISYYDSSNTDLKFVRARNADGSGLWNTPQTLDNNGNTGGRPSLAIVNGFPAIAYQEWNSFLLKFVRAQNANGSGFWNAPQTIDTFGGSADYNTLAIVNGFPAISYCEVGSSFVLKFGRAQNADGSGTWKFPMTVDSVGTVGRYSSLKVLSNGKAAISYYEEIDGNLRWAIINPPALSGALISELRYYGPNGSRDEFIELANTTTSLLDVSEWSITAGSVVVTIPAGAIIPAKGHFLLTNNGTGAGTGYSLGAYALGNRTYTGDIDLSNTIALKNAQGTVVDSVGSFLFQPSSRQHSFVRRMEGGVIVDTDSDRNDFNLVDVGSSVSTTDGSGVGPLTAARLGAPGPQNTASPTQRNGSVVLAPLSIAGSGVAADARMVSRGSTIDTKGRMGLRRTLKNNTGGTVTTLRFRIVGGTTGTSSTASGVADLRAISSAGVRYYASDGTTILQATVPVTLDAPSSPTEAPLTATSGNNGKGGGMNSSWTVALPSGGLAPGASVGVEFLFGIVADGNYRVVVNSEMLP